MSILEHGFGGLSDLRTALVSTTDALSLELLHRLVRKVLAYARSLAENRCELTLSATCFYFEIFLLDLFVPVSGPKFDLLMGHIWLLEAQLGVLKLAMALARSDRIEAHLVQPFRLVHLSRVSLQKLLRV